MPYPVLPPEPPALVQVLPSEQVANSRDFLSDQAIGDSIASATAPTTPSEIAPPESSPFNAATSAALLGRPYSVSYPILPARGSQLRDEAAIVPETEVAWSAATSNSPGQRRENPVKIGDATLVQQSRSDRQFFLASAETANTGVIHLLTQERGQDLREFQIPVSPENNQPPQAPAANETPPPTPATPQAPAADETPPPTSPTPQAPAADETPPPTPPTPGQETVTPLGNSGTIELNSDRQEYNTEQQVITAEGNVVMRFRQAVLSADRLEVNIPNRLAIAVGNVALRRGQQVLRGERFEYNFVQDSGVVLKASGEAYQPTAGSDLSGAPLPTDTETATPGQQPLSDRAILNQPLQQFTNPGGFGLVIGSDRNVPSLPPIEQGGTVNRVRYQAERVEFEGGVATATDVQITNDPFDPPELVLRTERAQFQQIAPLVSEITASRPRLVFDRRVAIPLFRNRIVIDERPRSPSLFNFGYDSDDRGGVFVEANFEPISNPGLRLSIRPQYFLQSAVAEGDFFSLDSFGLSARLDADLSPTTTLRGRAILTSLDPNNIEDETRASLRLQQSIGRGQPHLLNLEYSYRDRLYNGSLGYQTVRSSLGAVLTSPNITLGNTGLNLSYQAGAQLINADTDREDLLEPNRENDRISLSRYQVGASVGRGFTLLQGKALPPTPTQGVRYTPVPVVPYLRLNANLTGVATGYSSGDTQNTIGGSIGLEGQIGNFSKRFFDYTGFNISYYQIFPSGESPFKFDRVVDDKVLSGGIVQQIYGPFALGFQTAMNLDDSDFISTDYFLLYSRRTFNILLRYNPVLELGSVSFRINDFNWAGNPDLSEVRPVIQGVTR